jgi:hypothetical protein
VLVDLQAPGSPTPIPETVFGTAVVGDLSYGVVGSAEPIGGEAMAWTMRYDVLDGDVPLERRETTHVYHHPAHDTVIAQAAAHGFDCTPAGGHFWVLRRR